MHFSIVFPGQGSQSLGMLSTLADECSVVLDVFAEASQVLGYDAWALAQQGPEEQLNATEFTQPLLLAADVAVFRCWQLQDGPLPAVMAGHSLGEYSALVCANALSFEDAVQLVAKRGRYMQEAVQAGEGAMAAIIGLDDDALLKVCEDAAEGQVLSPANYNSIGQTVVAGHTSAVERAVELAKARGAKLAKRIPVSVPSHCALMQPAKERLAADLESVNFETPDIPVVQNADVASYEKPEHMREALVKQLVSPVRWVETISTIKAGGATAVLECGPGKVLTGLNKRIDRTLKLASMDSLGSITDAIKMLEE